MKKSHFLNFGPHVTQIFTCKRNLRLCKKTTAKIVANYHSTMEMKYLCCYPNTQIVAIHGENEFVKSCYS